MTKTEEKQMCEQERLAILRQTSKKKRQFVLTNTLLVISPFWQWQDKI